MMKALLAVLIFTCSFSCDLAGGEQESTYAANLDDATGHRVTLQAAIDAACAQPGGGTVFVPPGRWTVNRAPIGSYNRFAALSLHCQNVTIRGAGPESIIELVGDQGASTTVLLSIDPSAEHIHITELTLRCRANFADTAVEPCVNTDEQTHAIATTGVCSGATCKPIRDVEIDRVQFDWRRDTAARKGDAIRLLGNSPPTATAPGTGVYGVRVHHNTADPARSFVEIQRGVHDWQITNNTITGFTCDQCLVDGEATSTADPESRPTNGVVGDNTVKNAAGVQGGFDISVNASDGVTITGNTLPRGIAIANSTGVVVGHNTINFLNTTGDDGVIQVIKTCDGLVLNANSIRRGGHIGPVIKLVALGGVLCKSASITENNLQQDTAFHGIYSDALRESRIAGNIVRYTVAAPLYSAIYVRSVFTASPVIGLSIKDNQVIGDVGPEYGVTLDCSPGFCGAGINVSGNDSTVTTKGLHVNHPENVTAAITSSGNAMGPGAYGTVTISSGN